MRKENIRLIHLVKSLKIGGIEKSTITYSNELVDKIDFVGIFGCKGEFDNSNLLKQKVKRFIPEHCPQNKFYFLKTLKFLIRVIKKNSITHIHYHQRIFIPYILLIKVFCRPLPATEIPSYIKRHQKTRGFLALPGPPAPGKNNKT